MSTGTATLRPRTDSRPAKRKAKEFSTPTIPQNGELAAMTKPTPPKPREPRPQPDYMARLLKYQPKPMSAKAARELWEYERGDR